MNAATARSSKAPTNQVSWSDGRIIVRDPRLVEPGAERLCEQFVARAFSVSDVKGVGLDRSRGTITVRHTAGRRELGDLLGRLARAMRDDATPLVPLPRGALERSCTIHRNAGLLSTCRVVANRPGRLQLAHEVLRRDPVLAERAQRLLATVRGVRSVHIGLWTHHLVVEYDPGTLPMARLVRLTEEALDESCVWDRALPGTSRTRFALENTNLGLAAAADFVVPALMPVSAALLVYNNLRTFQVAWRQIRRRQLGLPVLYAVIVAATLASGQFLASALMSWCFKFWHGRLRHELASERRRLLEECLPLPRLARVITANGGEVLTPLERLVPGDRVVAEPGEPVPADGRVIDGGALIDERGVSGRTGAARKRPGDTVLAGSTVLAGVLRIEVAIPTDQTRAAAIGRALAAASSPTAGPIGPVGHAETFAERTVGPTLATAGLGLLVGDLTAATAILRPDYATGPGVAVPLETLRNAALCARRGIVARAPDVFERLAEVDCIVLEDGPALGRRALEVTGVQTHVAEVELLRSAASAFHHLADERAPALAEACRIRRAHLIDLAPIAFDPGVTVAHGKRRVRVRDYVASTGPSGPLVVEVDNTPVGLIHFGRSARLEAATAIARVRAVAPVPIVLVSNRPEADVSRLARDLGVDQHLSALSPLDMARFVESCRARGLRPAFVGDCRRHAAATAHAHTTISLLADANLDCDPADVLLLEQRLELFADLWETARSHRVRVRATQDWILVPNLVCVASAFLLGGTALTSVLISNLGTLGLYSRSKGALRALEPPRVRARLAQPA